MTNKIVIGLLIGLTVLLGYNSYSSGGLFGALGTGYNHLQKENFLQGLTAGRTGQFNLSNAGVVTVGTSGTALTRINSGTCYLAPAAATIAATTTLAIDCQATAAVGASGSSALTGVASGDAVVVTLSTTTAGVLNEGLSLKGATASSTQ